MASTQENGAQPDAITPVMPLDLEMRPMQLTTPVKRDEDPFLVAFNPNYDEENPLDWPKGRKWAVTDTLSATGFNRIMVSTIMAPALSTIKEELHMSTAESAMALSIYLLATAFGPLIIGPLSEIYGRKKIMHASNIWFLIWNIACGFANTKELLIASRFLAGFGASAIYALAGGVLGDVWKPEERGRGLRNFNMIPTLGSAVGPIIGGFMAGRTTWRWMFWSTSIFQVVMIAVSFTTTYETYAPLILKRRAERLRRDTGNDRYYTIYERLEQKKSVLSVVTRTLSRPLRLLVFHPILQVTSLILAFNYGILYIVLSSFADLWMQQYGQSVEISGLHYIACAFGELAGSLLGGPLMDWLFRRMLARSADGEHAPEFRIPMTFPGAFLIPLGLLVYGWTAQFHVHWAAVDVGVFVIMFGFQISQLPMQAYVMEAYPEHTSSALAASQFLRSLTAFLFPLFAPAMYGAMGYGWSNTALAAAGLVLGFPAPFIMWAYGARMRARARPSY